MSAITINDHVLIPWGPSGEVDWQRLWNTASVEALEGNEERAAYAPEPRLRLEWSPLSADAVDNLLRVQQIDAGMKAGRAATAYWGYGELLSEDAAAGTDVLSLVPPQWHFAVGDFVLLSDQQGTWEVAEIDAIECGKTLTLTANLTHAWPAGSLVWPILVGWLDIPDGQVITTQRMAARISFETDRLRLRTAPLPPCSVDVDDQSPYVDVTVECSTGDFDHHEIQRNSGGAGWEAIATGTTCPTVIRDQPAGGIEHCYRARSVNSSGASAWVEGGCVTPPGDDLPQSEFIQTQYDAATITGVTNGQPAMAWEDSGPLGRDLSAHINAVSQRPRFLHSGSGGPLVRFADTNSFSSNGADNDAHYDTPGGFIDLSAGLSVVMVFRVPMATTGGGRKVLVQFKSPANDVLVEFFVEAGGASAGFMSAGLGAPIGFGVTLATWYAFIGVVSPTATAVYRNGTLISSGAGYSLSPVALYPEYLFAASHFDATPLEMVDVRELTLVNRALTAGEVTAWQTYLATKHGL